MDELTRRKYVCIVEKERSTKTIIIIPSKGSPPSSSGGFQSSTAPSPQISVTFKGPFGGSGLETTVTVAVESHLPLAFFKVIVYWPVSSRFAFSTLIN